MEIFYEDLMENFDNKNLREKLMQLVNEHKIIIVKGLSSAQRHTVYRQMYYPLKFEKILLNENDEENTDIRIYNCKIKQKEKKQNDKNLNNETNEEKTEETKNEDEYVLEDSEHSEEESSCDSEFESDSEDSYLTEEDEQLTRLEDIGSQILERVVKNEKKIDRTRSRVNLVIMLNIIGWVMLYALDPVRVIHIRTTECEVF
jgi:hypothetical protein